MAANLFNPAFINPMFYPTYSMMNDFAASKLQQTSVNSSITHSPTSSFLQTTGTPTTNGLGLISSSNSLKSSPYSMCNILFNGAILNSNKSTNKTPSISSSSTLGSDANNNSTQQANNLINGKDSTLMSPSLNKNSNNLYDLRQSNHLNLLNRSRLDRERLSSISRLAGVVDNANDLNKDLSKENHFNYSNVNNSLHNQQNVSSVNQKSSSLLNNSLSNLNTTESITSLVDSNTLNSSMLSSYYENSMQFNNNNLNNLNSNSLINSSLSSNKTSNKKESQQQQESILNGTTKLFPSSAFTNHHSFSTNSLARLNNGLSNGLTNNSNLVANTNLLNGLAVSNAMQTNLTSSNLNSSGNSAFSSNGVLNTAIINSPSSSSANLAASALSAFSLTESKKRAFFSPLDNYNTSKSINNTKLMNDKSNSIDSNRTNSSLQSPFSDFNLELPFPNLNHQLSSQFHQHFNNSYNKFNYLDTICASNQSLNSSSNLNTSNSNSLESSLNDGSTGDDNLSSMSNSMSKSLNHLNHNGQHVKKPLNAFMLFMQENRRLVLTESSLKESAAINQKLGKMVSYLIAQL